MSCNSDDSGTEQPCVPIAALPQPAARYTVRGDEILLCRTNDQFGSLFAAADTGTPLPEWWNENGLSASARSIDDLRRSLRSGERIDTVVTAHHGEEPARSDSRYRLMSGRDDQQAHAGALIVITDPADNQTLADDRIASVISHDLRNPLDVAKAHLRAARETGAAEHFDQLEQAHERMERIIKDVLTLARGDRALTLSPAISLDRVATNAWDTVDTHGASLTIEEDLFAVEADPDRLQRLFENLFRNAVEHATRDSHTVADDEAPSASQPDSTDRATPTQVRVGQLEDGFFVSDDGQGIPPVDGERIFEPGYSNADGGTGLGLPIVERIAVAHGWTVSLAESADGGARFEFSGVEPEST